MSDKYSNFSELSASEPSGSYSVLARNNGSSVVVAAPHAGAIEPGTSEISLGVAANDLSVYLFEGLKSQGNSDLHITSSNFDEPQCLSLLKASDMVITIHGEQSEGEIVFLGGLHASALASLRTTLQDRGYSVQEHANPALQGHNKNNICNIGRLGAGVQLEISKGLRRTFFASLTQNGRDQPTPRLNDFCVVIRYGLHTNGP
ncbi:replication protein [Candidatus Accumulibacter phosphatis]|uniref:Replication protein n=1 Tax=Candidatus Accumulibacter phosphatis TaxID=327160 RepID=A0ABX1TXN2_9PROT|nr:replication protein [Candidatus Accumulibacter phosphatis]